MVVCRLLHALACMSAVSDAMRAPSGWHTRRDPLTGRFAFYQGSVGPVQIKGVSMSGLETGTQHDGQKGGGGGYWVFSSGKPESPMDVLQNVVDTLASPDGWNSTAVRIPMCGSAYLQKFRMYDWDDSTFVIGYRDWVDTAVQAVRSRGMVAIIDNHVWAIGPESNRERNVGMEDGCTGINRIKDGQTFKDSCGPHDWFGQYHSDRTGVTYHADTHDDIRTWACPISNADGCSLDNIKRSNNTEHFLNLWYELAKKYEGDDGIWFELFNEPYQKKSAQFNDPACTYEPSSGAMNCPPGHGFGDNIPDDDYDWTFWSQLMNETIHMVRTISSNIVLVSGLDYNYDYGGSLSPTSGGPIARPTELLPWKHLENVAYAFHPYQHGACCGEIGENEDLSKTDPYQSAFCLYRPSATKPSNSPLPIPGGIDPPTASCDTVGYSPTEAKKAPPCQWAEYAVKPEWPDGRRGLCAGSPAHCGSRDFRNCTSLDSGHPEAGGWAAYVLPMQQYGPLIATELGSFDCSSPYVAAFVKWAAKHYVSYTAWALWPQNKGGPGAGACGYPSIMLPRADSQAGFHESKTSGEHGCEDSQSCKAILQPLKWSGQVIHDDLHGIAPAELPPMPPFPPPTPPFPPPTPSPPHGCPIEYIRSCLHTCEKEHTQLPVDEDGLKECDLTCIRECQHNGFAPFTEADDVPESNDAAKSISPLLSSFCSFDLCENVTSEKDLRDSIGRQNVRCIQINTPELILTDEVFIDRSPTSAQCASCPPLCISVGEGLTHAVLNRKGSVGGPVLTVTNGSDVTLANLTLTGAISSAGSSSHDGGIGNLGTLRLFDTEVSDNRASNTTHGGGGGIGNNGTLLMVVSRVFNNTADGPDTGGGIANGGRLEMYSSSVADNVAEISAGGGIGNSGDAYLWNTTISGNVAKTSSGGGIGSSGTVRMIKGSVTRNMAQTAGGGIGTGQEQSSGAPQIFNATDVIISKNLVTNGGGGGIGNGFGLVYIRGVTVSDNSASSAVGIGNGGGMLIAHDSYIQRNKVAATGGGGGIGNSLGGLLHIMNTVISENEGSTGGGISSKTNAGGNTSVVIVMDSEIARNNATDATGTGGGLDVRAGATALINTSVTGNTARSYGGGVSNSGGVMDLVQVRFTKNTAKNGGGFGQPSHDSSTVMDSCTFEDNHAKAIDCFVDNKGAASNVACMGGGIFKYGNLSTRNVTLVSNSAQSGGGLHNDGNSLEEVTAIEGGLIHNNSAARGAGIYNDGFNLFLTEVAITGNHAPPRAGRSLYNIVRGQGGEGVSYALPAPRGRYIANSFKCQSAICDFSSCPNICPDKFNGLTLTYLPVFIDEDFPYACAPGFHADSVDVGSQNNSECSGMCPKGHYCPGSDTTPQLCDPGTFTSGKGSQQRNDCTGCPLGHWCNAGALHPCESGRYGPQVNQTNAASCAVCSYGHYCGPTPGQAAQQPCKEGFYNDTEGMTSSDSCTICEIGFWCSAGRINKCAPNSFGSGCGNSSITPTRVSQRKACTPCTPKSETLPNAIATSMADCRCVNGYYRRNTSSDDCRIFPPGAANSSVYAEAPDTIENIRLKSGHWRAANTTDDVRSCPKKKTCTGDVGRALGDYCNTNSTGIDPAVPYCTHCLQHPEYYLDLGSGTCKPCAGSRYALLGYMLAICAVCFSMLLLRCVARMHWQRLVAYYQYGKVVVRRLSPTAKFKTAQSFYQIVTHLHGVFGVVIPPDFETVSGHLELFSLNIFALPALEMQCYGLPTFFSQLLLRAMLPLTLIVTAFIYQLGRRTPERALPFFLWLSFLVYSLVASPAFQAFNCESFGDTNSTSYLRADYSVICSVDGKEEPSYTQLKVFASLVIVVYPVGVPLMYVVLFAIAARRRSLRAHLKFLTQSYKQEFYFWELISTLQKLLLASFFALPFFGHGTLMQLLAALVAQLVFLIVQVYASPFKRAADNYFAVCSNVMLVFVFSSCVVLEMDGMLYTLRDVLTPSLNQRYQISAGLSTSLLITSSLTVLVVLLLIYLRSLVAVHHLPPLCWASDGNVVEPQPVDGWHALISHVWITGQDQARVLREMLAVMLPGLQLFIDVDALDSAGGVGELEVIVRRCKAMLVFLSDGYCKQWHGFEMDAAWPSAKPACPAAWLTGLCCAAVASKNCMRELRAALAYGLPLVIVRETDIKKGGLPLEELVEQCPTELRDQVFAFPVVEWHRVKDFQLVSLRLIGEGLLKPSMEDHSDDSFEIWGDPARNGPTIKGVVATSIHNQGAEDLANELLAAANGSMSARSRRRKRLHLNQSAINGSGQVAHEPTCFLLLLDAYTFDDSALEDEVKQAIRAQQKIVLAHDVATTFDDIIARTPQSLKQLGLYNALATPLLEDGEFRQVSLRLLAAKIASTARKPTAAAAEDTWREGSCACVKRVLTACMNWSWTRLTGQPQIHPAQFSQPLLSDAQMAIPPTHLHSQPPDQSSDLTQLQNDSPNTLADPQVGSSAPFTAASNEGDVAASTELADAQADPSAPFTAASNEGDVAASTELAGAQADPSAPFTAALPVAASSSEADVAPAAPTHHSGAVSSSSSLPAP